jgi:hypothetical protein
MYKSLEERKQKWRRFLNNEGGEKTIYLIEPEEETAKAGARPLPQPGLINERIAWAYEDYVNKLDQTEWLPDDKLPVLSPYTGTEIFAGAFGCKVYYPDNDMPFAIPKYNKIKKTASMKTPNIHDTPLDSLFEIARRLQQKAGPGALLHLPDIQSPFDVAALILNKEEFYTAMIEDPHAIHEMIYKTKTLLTTFLDEWFYEFGSSYIAHYPSYYMEGGVTLSEDEVGAFGPEMFREFILETLNELSEKYGGIGIHCCADSEHQWENFLKVKGLRLINLGNKIDFINRSVKFFGNSVAQWPIAHRISNTESEPSWLRECPDDARVVLSYQAPNKKAAQETAKHAEEQSQKRRSY